MHVLELTHYTVPSRNLAGFLAARPGIDAAMRSLPGCLEARTAKVDADRFVDVVTWADHASAERAMALAMADERLAPLFTLIEDVTMEHAEVLGG